MTLRIQRNVALMSAEEHQNAWPLWTEFMRTAGRWRCGGRCGTITMTLQEFGRRFGDPHQLGSDDEKITALWYFMTPRGPVQVSDYWWNRENELSVRAADARALRWFRRWCKLFDVTFS